LSEDELIHAGEISGVFGVKGWVKVFSHTSPRENILHYSPWQLKRKDQIQQVKLRTGHRQGKGVVASLESLDNRDIATGYIGWEIWIKKSQLPVLATGEYYWTDLIGLQVETNQGVALGRVDSLMETGANDVLIVKDRQQERLIPFVFDQFIKTVDLTSKQIIVDWDPDF